MKCAHCPMLAYPDVECVSHAGLSRCHLVDPADPRFHPRGRESVRMHSLQLAGRWVEPDPVVAAEARSRGERGLLATRAAKRCPYGDPFAQEGCRACRWCYSRKARVWLSDCTECAGYGTLR